MKESIQSDANAAGLGIEIVFLGLQGVHPPPEVAAEYQKVIGAIQSKQALILNAEALRNKQLTLLGGSVLQVSDLYDLAEQYQRAQEKGDEEARFLDAIIVFACEKNKKTTTWLAIPQTFEKELAMF